MSIHLDSGGFAGTVKTMDGIRSSLAIIKQELALIGRTYSKGLGKP